MNKKMRFSRQDLLSSGLGKLFENLDGKLRSNRDNAILQHTFAEFANMLNMEEQMLPMIPVHFNMFRFVMVEPKLVLEMRSMVLL